MGTDPILKCPLARESGYPIEIVPAYFLTDGTPELIRRDVLGVRIPTDVSEKVRRIHQQDIEQGWGPLIRLTCLAHYCSICIPGVSWGRGPNFFIVPTGNSSSTPGVENTSYAIPPCFSEP